MQESFCEKTIKTIASAFIVVGIVTAVFKGVDRQDVLLCAESIAFALLVGSGLIAVSCFLGKRRILKKNATREFTEEYRTELLEKKKKGIKTSSLIFALLAAVFVAEFIADIFYSPIKIENLTEMGLYEEAFDTVMKSGISVEKKKKYGEVLYPLMKEAFKKEKKSGEVLFVDNMTISAKGDSLYLEKDGKSELLYTCGEYGTANARFENDFIYSCGQVIFIEEISEAQNKYKNIVAIDLKTKNYQILLSETKAFYLDKLKNGKILLSDNPCRVYDPVKRKVLKNELKDEEWDYIYTTM